MPDKRHSDELNNILWDFDRLTNNLMAQPTDPFWRQIIDDVHKYVELDTHRFALDKAPICPLVQSDRPDVIYNGSSFVMGIECFQFDASKKTKKGSTQIRKQIEAEQRIKNKIQTAKLPSEGYLSIDAEVDAEFSIQYYIDSLLAALCTHAKSIGQYREHLQLAYPERKVYLSFFIEDATAIGNYIVVNGKTEPLSPLRIAPLLDFLLSLKGLDYVVIKTTNMYVPSLQFLKVDMDTFRPLYSKCYLPDTKFIQYRYKIESHVYSMG